MNISQREVVGRGWTKNLIVKYLRPYGIRDDVAANDHTSPWSFDLEAVERLEAEEPEIRELVEAHAQAAQRAASTEKLRATLAAKKEAAAELDRALARDAGFPESSAWLQGLAPKVLKSAPAFTSARGAGWRVLAKAGPVVGDRIEVNLAPQQGLARPPKEQEVTAVSPLGARDGVLWVLLGVDDPERLVEKRAAAEKAAKAKAEAERIEALKRAKAAQEEALRKAEADARQAEVLARSKLAHREETERVSSLSVEAARDEVVLHTEQCLRQLEIAPEALLDLRLRRDAAVNGKSEMRIRSMAVEVAVAGRLDVPANPGDLFGWRTVVADVEEAFRRARAGRLPMTVLNKRRTKEVPVAARFVSLSGDWRIVAHSDAIQGEHVTVTKNGGERKSMLINSDLVHLGQFDGRDLLLILDFEDVQS
ncbi:hypothetical protein AXK56_20730 [Tsukamurella pulmonis]|uniref:Uncharacterized protein n=1 Tax=Tsukamurella pulmonis TaxID=47312 RepID=A0A1H1H5U0_9ACTN|nr:hypothetical protein [Tsukamurella pulmonis]KXO95012.1 hypothetical protein AXK56_20730 [Tsukamurella pulmonis]SDR20852.1 hypothetical protein SAMN04489765_3844 [Tsukamurella pulmonis]SUP15858.1 Uncharacterised protein [Tsukamurella pulmonis]